MIHFLGDDGAYGIEILAGGIRRESDKADVLIALIESERGEDLVGRDVDGDDRIVVEC